MISASVLPAIVLNAAAPPQLMLTPVVFAFATETLAATATASIFASLVATTSTLPEAAVACDFSIAALTVLSISFVAIEMPTAREPLPPRDAF